MDLRGVRSLKTKWVQNTSPDVMNSLFPKANFFLGHPVDSIIMMFSLFVDYLKYQMAAGI